MGRLQRSWALGKESLAVLKRTPNLIWFPVLSGLGTIGLTASFALPVWFATGGKNLEQIRPEIGYPLIAAYYLLSYFIVIFFNSGLVYCAHESLQGRKVTFGDGISAALKRLPAIFGWTLIAATVGTLLQMISERSGIIGKIVVAILGTVWNLLTYFVVPIIVIEHGSPISALKKSGGMLKRTWGENLIGSAGIGLAMGLIALLPIPLMVLAFIIAPAYGFVMLACTLVYWLILAIVGASLSGVYQTALYVYAETGTPPSAYTNEYIVGAFQSRPDGFAQKIRKRF